MSDPDEDDFSDLDAIIAEDESRRGQAASLKSKQKRLGNRGISDDERIKLLAEIRSVEDRFIWRPVAAVALFHSQHCLSCDHSHKFFIGWMTEQHHKQDPHCRRFTRGKPIEHLPSRIEIHAQPDVELCGDCAEAQLQYDKLVESIYEINPGPQLPLHPQPLNQHQAHLHEGPARDDGAETS